MIMSHTLGFKHPPEFADPTVACMRTLRYKIFPGSVNDDVTQTGLNIQLFADPTGLRTQKYKISKGVSMIMSHTLA